MNDAALHGTTLGKSCSTFIKCSYVPPTITTAMQSMDKPRLHSLTGDVRATKMRFKIGLAQHDTNSLVNSSVLLQ